MLNRLHKNNHAVDIQIFKPLFWIGLAISFFLTGCGGTKALPAASTTSKLLKQNNTSAYFTGLLVVDLKTKDTLASLNAKRFFIPASTVKIVTLYAANHLLKDSLPSLFYAHKNDTTYIKGTGDPSWQHPYFKDQTALEFLKNQKNISLYPHNYKDDAFGPGWAWEDYPYAFSAERSGICLYGNVVNFTKKDTLSISPDFFRKNTTTKGQVTTRERHANSFTIASNFKDTIAIPFMTGNKVVKNLLEAELQKTVTLVNRFPEVVPKMLLGHSTDSIYRRMLYKSDNFLAEQLMLTASATLSDSLSFKIAKKHVLDNYLNTLKQTPRWVDGSGLSRYNLFTPEFLVGVLSQLWITIPQQRLLHLFPKWDANGTVPLEKEVENPSFIYGKSGSMGGVYNLCGYLKTKSGRYLAFSFMNNHFQQPSADIRKRMFETLCRIRDAY
ncbi:Peptidase S13 D-Ala-D-Ala carboxypeptidase C [Croceitalea dokdonensis DOKDO 023]|uniref:Peptidase S13 D-Ala-D-Ala carboxypeptidase C n=1 Tax=Croceitalea dokdonensis DOKDO 023 TaxID=1300341 RepID=A0A0P7ACN1_9FLAO|nr:D-alanyl-D-alanine carboxypeptidase [Croceitalea dokdonensis]KPM30250.1 Peptidase S13 D-Ala-D-Ala carboxypeptidase C [Croceitalea dokdonensis DOKDO 023]